MTLWWGCLAVELAAAVLAWAAGHKIRRRSSDATSGIIRDQNPHRALALLLTFAPVADVAMKLNQVLHLEPFRVVRPFGPFVGAVAPWYLGELAVTLAWPAELATVALVVFGSGGSSDESRRRWPPLALLGPGAVWGLAVVAAVVTHPLPRAWTAALLQSWSLFAVAVGVVAVVRAWRSTARWGRSPAHACVLVLLGTEAAVAVVGPYATDPFADWDAARVLYLVGFGTVAVVFARGSTNRESPAG